MHLNVIAHLTDEIPHVDGGMVCQMLFRHLTHTQAIMVLDSDALMVVAEPGTSLASPDDLSALHAFHLKAKDAFVLHRGTWHWPPSFTGIGDTRGVKLLKQGRDAPDQPECDLSRIAFKLRRVHPFRAEYFVFRAGHFVGRWPGTCR